MMKVFTRDEFDYSTAKVGDLVEEAVVEDAINVLPPACMRSDCTQMGEPYSHRVDPKTGKFRATYSTFKAVSGTYPNRIWKYCGKCFRGENVERGTDPAWM